MHRRRRRRRRRSPLRWILPLLMLLVAAMGIGVRYITRELPYRNAESFMPEDPELTIRQSSGGSLLLSWKPAERADFYCVEILRPAKEGQTEPESIFQGYAYDPTGYPLPGLPPETELTVRVSSVIEYGTGDSLARRMCGNPAEATLFFDAPTVTDLAWNADPDAGRVDISCKLRNATHCRIYLAEEGKEPVYLKSVSGTGFCLNIGQGGELPELAWGGAYTLLFDAYYQTEEITFYGGLRDSVTVSREALLGRELLPVLTDEGNNICTITWNETKGEHYEVQRLDGLQQWITVAPIPGDAERSYTTKHLENLADYRFRVVAVGGDTLPGQPYAAVSQELKFETGISPVYCTVWPVKDMDAYDAPEGGAVTGQVVQARAYWVMDVQGDMFGIALDGKTCYIDGRYCMINLPEYLGELCAYDITNSYSSIYMVHEYALPEITDTVIDGYKHVNMGEQSPLVPLLYPTANKLLKAALDAKERGLRLKIYDAFRPNRATQQIYDLTKAVLEKPIPDAPFRGSRPADMPDTSPGEILTYGALMTRGGWDLSNFLAPGRSMHNLGIAVDLTLEELGTGEELKMQTSMHDLSSYSVLTRNNENARLLAQIMKDAGMGDLVSEWWHFQDNEIKETLDLPSVWQGVNCACWVTDSNGWRYRNRDGSYVRNTTMTFGDVVYEFDGDGYAVPVE